MKHDKIKLIYTGADLNEVIQSWGEGTTVADHLHGLVVLMEGADPITEPKQLEEWVDHGVRIVAPAWQTKPAILQELDLKVS